MVQTSVKKLVCALTFVVALAGWSQAATVAKPMPLHPSPDATIEHAIQLKFAKSKINGEHFTVSVHNGVAVIEGKTGVMQHKGVATRLAKAGGAVSVQNHIQVSDAAKAKAAAQLTKNTTAAAGSGTAAPPRPTKRLSCHWHSEVASAIAQPRDRSSWYGMLFRETDSMGKSSRRVRAAQTANTARSANRKFRAGTPGPPRSWPSFWPERLCACCQVCC